MVPNMYTFGIHIAPATARVETVRGSDRCRAVSDPLE
jgi:hypothetical protein